MSFGWRWPTCHGFLPVGIFSAVVGLGVTLLLTQELVEFDFLRLVGSIGRLASFLTRFFAVPEWNYLPQLGVRLLETWEITFLSTLIALVFSLPISFFAARNSSPHPALFHTARIGLSCVRALPELVWAVVFVSALGLGPLPGVFAMALVSIGFMAKFLPRALRSCLRAPSKG